MPARIRRWIRVEWPFFLVVGLVIGAVAYLSLFPGHWRRAAAVISTALLVGAILRATLPPGRVGMLGVRGRVLDTASLAVLGGVVLSVAIRLQ
jgi:hypothetical protein